VTSERIRVSLFEIETHWSIDDLQDAHLLLDAFDDAQRKADAKKPKAPEPKGRKRR
jgi:hypothetical protein